MDTQVEVLPNNSHLTLRGACLVINYEVTRLVFGGEVAVVPGPWSLVTGRTATLPNKLNKQISTIRHIPLTPVHLHHRTAHVANTKKQTRVCDAVMW